MKNLRKKGSLLNSHLHLLISSVICIFVFSPVVLSSGVRSIWNAVRILDIAAAESNKYTNEVADFASGSGSNEKLEPAPIDPKRIWAVLVAGSNEFYNYRHQADVCHAYQILTRNGVPPKQIITMMYDDIAYSKENPTPGVIINRPNGTNVYEGVIIDYNGTDVTPENFIKVLLGDQEGLKGVGSGKVLQSGPNDHVFINFVDHGAPGLVGFPNDELHAKELENTFKTMHLSKKYGKLVFYLEACESGSMFTNLLPAHWNIFATTAANGQESSYACYYDEAMETYLGDVYSIKWMENADQSNLEQETLQSQFLVVRNETNTSHVMEFGDKSLRNLPVADFLGYSETRLTLPEVELDAVDSVDVVPSILQRKLARTQNKEKRQELKSQLKRLYKMRKLVTAQMMDIIEQVTGHGQNMTVEFQQDLLQSRHELTNYDCYERVTRHFSKQCFSIAKNPYVTRKLYLLVNMCELGMDSQKIVNAMTNTCHHRGIVGIY
ncbi:unnamed protein product [Orchesella dallaii]|uniref:Legumain prodomain domain-containing protein n=1 Tax=Orchesella dallaii TaxID=48710 RepID=A0ABP1Q8I6_9HEXA